MAVTQRPRVFLDFAIGSDPLGRVIFELFNDTAPKTAENFRALCTGEKGMSALGHTLFYKNSIVHRSIQDFMIQGGDFTKHNGTGGESIYGGMFDDEHLDRPVDAEGLLCMANRGPNTNGSQFFVTLRPCPHLSGKHVVFGRVLRGFEEVIKKIEQVPTDAKNRPTTPVTIVNCGELELRRKPDNASQKPNAAPLASESKEKKEKVKERRRKSRSRSPDSDDSRSRRKKHKPKKHREDTPPRSPSVPRQETEEEYDARLEREEQERLAVARKRELERLKNTEVVFKDGVRFKGRGRMKFIDPEISHR